MLSSAVVSAAFKWTRSACKRPRGYSQRNAELITEYSQLLFDVQGSLEFVDGVLHMWIVFDALLDGF